MAINIFFAWRLTRTAVFEMLIGPQCEGGKWGPQIIVGSASQGLWDLSYFHASGFKV